MGTHCYANVSSCSEEEVGMLREVADKRLRMGEKEVIIIHFGVKGFLGLRGWIYA